MKIIHLIFDFNMGGTESMLVDIVNEQSKSQDVTLVIINNSYDQILIDGISDRVKIKFFNRTCSGRNPLPFLHLNLWLLFQHPDVVHYHNYVTPKVLMPFFRLCSTVHALSVPSDYFSRCFQIFAISDAVRDDILSHGDFPVKVIPNGIDIERIKTHVYNQSRSLFRIVQVARLDHSIKGQDILIKGIGYLKRNGISDVTLDLIGEGDSLEMLKNLAKEEGVEEQVRFVGKKDRAYIYSHLCDYDLMCHPSRIEGFGLTIAEALAAKLPVLVPDEDGPFEVIGHGAFGQVFKKGNSDDFNHQLHNIYNHYDALFTPEKIAQGYNHVVENYSLKQMVDQYLQEYLPPEKR